MFGPGALFLWDGWQSVRSVFWKIVIKNNGEVTVTKNDGEPVIAKNSDKRYMIENAKVYSLPESGGPGTYGFTISGVAILATALLLFINNKRREEEAKRS